MVLLTMTPTIVEGLELRGTTIIPGIEEDKDSSKGNDPSLDDPAVGNPISHGQIVELWRELKLHSDDGVKFTLENLLKGARIYVPPPPPKPEKVSHARALVVFNST